MSELPDLEPLPFNCPQCREPLLAVRSQLETGRRIIYLCIDHGWFCIDDEGCLQRDALLFRASI